MPLHRFAPLVLIGALQPLGQAIPLQVPVLGDVAAIIEASARLAPEAGQSGSAQDRSGGTLRGRRRRSTPKTGSGSGTGVGDEPADGTPVTAAPAPAPDVESDSTDSMLVVSAREHALVMQDPVSGERSAFFRVGLSPEMVAVSEDGRTAVVTNRGDRLSGNSICVVDLYATNLVRTIPLQVTRQNPDQTITKRSYHRPSGIAFLPGKERVVVSCGIEGALLLVDLVEARVIGDVLLEAEGSNAVVVDHSGEFAFVANRESGTVSVVRLDRMRLINTIEAGGGPEGMALHPVRNEIWLANTATNSISIIDVEKADEVVEFACGAMPSDIAFTPNGKYAMVVNMQEGNISVFNSETRRIRTLINLERVSAAQAKARPVGMPGHFGRSPLPTRILMGPDGNHAYVATRRSDQLHEIDLHTWFVTRTMATATAPTGLAWSRVANDSKRARTGPIRR